MFPNYRVDTNGTGFGILKNAPPIENLKSQINETMK